MSDQDIETIPASFEQDRRDYWAMREQLLASYRGKWVAVHKATFVENTVKAVDKCADFDYFSREKT